MERSKRGHGHKHTVWIGALGVLAGLILMIHVPTLKGISGATVLFGSFHLAGAYVTFGSLYSMGGETLVRRWLVRPVAPGRFDFGWRTVWRNGLGIAAVIALSVAVAVEATKPHLWPVAAAVLLLVPVFVAGVVILQTSLRPEFAALPMVDLLWSDSDHVLDAGCGSGRTTVALGPLLREGRVTAVDRFDAGYIADGGRALLDRNLAIASLTANVTVQTADLTSLPFADGTFDSAVSTSVFDHLGSKKRAACSEVFRVLRPGGRFLLAVWVPGWSAFAVANVFSFALTSKVEWRSILTGTGFHTVTSGIFNHSWYLLVEKPAASSGEQQPDSGGTH